MFYLLSCLENKPEYKERVLDDSDQFAKIGFANIEEFKAVTKREPRYHDTRDISEKPDVSMPYTTRYYAVTNDPSASIVVLSLQNTDVDFLLTAANPARRIGGVFSTWFEIWEKDIDNTCVLIVENDKFDGEEVMLSVRHNCLSSEELLLQAAKQTLGIS